MKLKPTMIAIFERRGAAKRFECDGWVTTAMKYMKVCDSQIAFGRSSHTCANRSEEGGGGEFRILTEGSILMGTTSSLKMREIVSPFNRNFPFNYPILGKGRGHIKCQKSKRERLPIPLRSSNIGAVVCFPRKTICSTRGRGVRNLIVIESKPRF